MDHFRENRSGGALLHGYLQETLTHTNRGKLDPSKRRKINKQLEADGFDGHTRGYFRSPGQAMDVAAGSLMKWGVEIDEPVLASAFRGKTGSTSFHVAHVIPGEDPLRITNSMFFVQWTEMRTGYEVIAYMT